MRYTCVDPSEFLYPDITDYRSSCSEIRILAVRGSYANAQILLSDVTAAEITVKTEGWDPDLFEMVAIPVEQNFNLNESNAAPHMPERIAPYFVYDCLKPTDGMVKVGEGGVCAVYFSQKIDTDAPVGVTAAKIIIGSIEIPVTLEVSAVCVPAESLTMIQGYIPGNVAKYHHAERGSAEFEALDTAYLLQLRRMRQNMLYCPPPKATALGDNKYDISFAEMEKFMAKAISLGYTKFNFGLGFRRHWDEPTILINEMDSMSFECYCYLAQMLPQLVSFLKERGWIDKLILGIADEPNEANAKDYRALCGLVRKLAPELRLLDAMSFGPVHGAIDIWIPLNAEYQQHRDNIETFRTYGDEIWYYDCCGPRGNGFINRFLDYPLLATRYHFWAGYLYNLTGYLHWAGNFWQPEQDPFTQSCPIHRNANLVGLLPPGDTHIMYPGDGGPWMSVRLENYRASAEEYELLRALAEKDKETADAVCRTVCRAFDDVDYDPRHFRLARETLIRALEQ